MKSKNYLSKVIRHGLLCLFITNFFLLLLYSTSSVANAEPRQKKSYGLKDLRLAASLNKKAQEYYEQGKYFEAEPLLKKALAIQEAVFGREHEEVVPTLYNLAMLYYVQGRYAKAESLHKRVLAIDEKALGPDDPDIATDLNNLASV